MKLVTLVKQVKCKNSLRVFVYVGFGLFLWIYFVSSFCCRYADLISSIPSEFWSAMFIVVAVALRDRLFLMLAVIYLIFANINPVTHLQKIHIPEYVPVKVCSYNSRFFFAQNRKKAIEALKALNCDIYVIQEVWHSQEIYQQLIDSYVKKYFKEYHSVNWAEFWTLFKNDIQLLHQVRPENEGFLALELSIKRFNRRYILNLINIHIWNPLVTRNTLSFVEASFWQQPAARLSPYTVRKRQVSDLRKFLEQKVVSNYVIVGDFNTLPSHALIAFKKWAPKKQQKYFRKVSPGIFYATYPVALPFLAIDHAFLGNDLQLEHIYVKDLGSSDHKAFIMKIGVPESKKEAVAFNSN